MKSILKNSAIVAVLVFGAVKISNAQVKIGTAPTVIDPNSNLEIQASDNASYKIKVHKATGKLTIADGSQGVNKVLTSDLNGVATWQTLSSGCASFEASRATQSVPIQDTSTDPFTQLVPSTESYDPGNTYNSAIGSYTIPATGFYIFTGISSDVISNLGSASRHSTLAIHSAQRNTIIARSTQQRVAYSDGAWNNVSISAYLLVGDVITLQHIVVHVAASGVKPGPTINVNNIRFSGSRIDCDRN